MIAAGARVFVFVEYVPIEPGTEGMVLDDGGARRCTRASIASTKNILQFSSVFPVTRMPLGAALRQAGVFSTSALRAISRHVRRRHSRIRTWAGAPPRSHQVPTDQPDPVAPSPSHRDKRRVRSLDEPGVGRGTAGRGTEVRRVKIPGMTAEGAGSETIMETRGHHTIS